MSLGLILQFIMALPSIWKMIKEILDMIHGLPVSEQPAARERLHFLLRNVPKTHTVGSAEQSELQVFLQNLKARVSGQPKV